MARARITIDTDDHALADEPSELLCASEIFDRLPPITPTGGTRGDGRPRLCLSLPAVRAGTLTSTGARGHGRLAHSSNFSQARNSVETTCTKPITRLAKTSQIRASTHPPAVPSPGIGGAEIDEVARRPEQEGCQRELEQGFQERSEPFDGADEDIDHALDLRA